LFQSKGAFDLKASNEHMEDEGAKYQQTKGIGKMEHTLYSWRRSEK